MVNKYQYKKPLWSNRRKYVNLIFLDNKKYNLGRYDAG